MSGFSEADIDLEKLFLPAWAQEKPGKNPYEKYSGEERGEPRREKRGGRFSDERSGQRPRSPKKFGDKKDFRRGDRHGDRREHERPEPPAPLPDVAVSFLPDEKGVEQIARQIKMTGRAYPLFQIAHLVLQKPERYSVRLSVKKKADGAISQPLFVCALDDSPWLSEDEAVAHVLKNHFATFYQAERTATEPPKGTYTFVAQCGMSGVILGPPNYHDYQNQLRKLHAERFSRMPFDVFKSRVKIVKDESVVKKWIEEQSFKTEYICLNVAEPLKLASMEEVEKHFRVTHKEAIIKPVETLVLNGVKSRNLRSRDLLRLVRVEWENQRHFPLQIATSLSKQFASQSLQFFKKDKTVVHVSVARPQYLDLETTPVSENIKRIVEFVNANPRCNRRKLIERLSPTPTPVPAAEALAPTVETPAPTAEGGATKPTQLVQLKVDEPTPEQTALIADLHWLIHQGHVLEFADGRLETAKKPLPRLPKPEKKPAEEAKPATEAKPAGEVPSSEEAKSAEQSSIEIMSVEAVQSEVASTEAPPPTEEVPSPS
jgi:hypothetical protein